jgi:peptidoglycan/xylan/chitin deacetylase (PgdA/CDA1 family)
LKERIDMRIRRATTFEEEMSRTKQTLIVFVAACFYYSGLVKLVRWWIRHSGRRLIILNYHRASEGDLRRHLLYLRRHYRVMHLEEALEELYMSCKQEKQTRDRRTPLVLTFDDGYHDNYMHGFPLARELQVPITIFLIPGYIESGHCFWWLVGEQLVRHTHVDKVTIEGCTYHLGQPEEREALAQVISTRLYYAKSVTEREAFIEMVREALAVPSTVISEGNTVLSWAEIREMEASRWVSFGAHTMHHPVLAFLLDPTEVEREVSECRTVLEQQLGHPVRTFAYPFGRPEHIRAEALRAVQEASYDWAVTTIYGINIPQTDPRQLRRMVSHVNRHWLVMAAEITGVWQLFISLYRKLRVGVKI